MTTTQVTIDVRPAVRGPLVSTPPAATVSVEADDLAPESVQTLIFSASTCAEDLVRACRGEPKAVDAEVVEPELVPRWDGGRLAAVEVGGVMYAVVPEGGDERTVDGSTAGAVVEAVREAILGDEPAIASRSLHSAADRAAAVVRQHEPIVRLELPVIGIEEACTRVRNAVLGGLMAEGERWRYEQAVERACATLRDQPLPDDSRVYLRPATS